MFRFLILPIFGVLCQMDTCSTVSDGACQDSQVKTYLKLSKSDQDSQWNDNKRYKLSIRGGIN